MARQMMLGQDRNILQRPEFFDFNAVKFGSAKIFQYTEAEKK